MSLMNADAVRPTLFYLHALGSSHRAFDGVKAALEDRFEVVGIDLPGFGEASPSNGVHLGEVVDLVTETIASHMATRWMLIGHSMGGKIASIVASRALAGKLGLFGLAGVVLLAGSTPSPEPMSEERRDKMISWAAEGGLSEDAIREFLDANTGSPLTPDRERLAVDDLHRTTSEGWVAWLERGSREDWSQAVGVLDLPALILVGSKDGDLGEAGQRRFNMPHYPRAQLSVLEGAAHLLPLERPGEIARAIDDFWRATAGIGPSVPQDYANLISSSRVSARTRSILARRSVACDPNYVPSVLDGDELETLRAIASCVVPQGQHPLDLAARVDAQLSAGKGDGWRNAILPLDAEAYRISLRLLAGFSTLSPDAQIQTLRMVETGVFATGVSSFTSDQMSAWFEDARSDLMRQWLAHPATMARIGFDGFANGGDGERKQGFERLLAGEREGWEPGPELFA